MKLRHVMATAALGLGATLTGGCATVHDLNQDTCMKTDSMGPKTDLPSLLEKITRLIPSYHYVRPSSPCLYSQYFMGVVNIAQIPGNENNYHIQGLVVDKYEPLKKSDDKLARQAVAMMDQRLESQGLTIKTFTERYNANKPKVVNLGKESACWNYKTLENGKMYDERMCNVAVNFELPPQP